jgi:hypothetical protein
MSAPPVIVTVPHEAGPVEVCVRHEEWGVEVDVRPQGSRQVWTPITMLGGKVEVRPA